MFIYRKPTVAVVEDAGEGEGGGWMWWWIGGGSGWLVGWEGMQDEG